MIVVLIFCFHLDGKLSLKIDILPCASEFIFIFANTFSPREGQIISCDGEQRRVQDNFNKLSS